MNENRATDETIKFLVVLIVAAVIVAMFLVLRPAPAAPQSVERVSLDTPVGEVKPAVAHDAVGQDAGPSPSASPTPTEPAGPHHTSEAQPATQGGAGADSGSLAEPEPVEAEIGEPLVIEAPAPYRQLACEKWSDGSPGSSPAGWYAGNFPSPVVDAHPTWFRGCTVAVIGQ